MRRTVRRGAVLVMIGLLGMLLGEQLMPLAKRVASGHPVFIDRLDAQSIAHLFGRLPAGTSSPPSPTTGGTHSAGSGHDEKS